MMQRPIPHPLRLLPRIRNPALLIPLQQLLHLRHLRRPNRIPDRRPRRCNTDQPRHGRPERVREEVEQLVAEGGLGGAAGGADDDGGDGEEDVEEVERAGVGPEDDFEAAGEGGAEVGGAFAEFGREGAGRFEGGGAAAEAAGEEEDGEKGDGVVWVWG